MRHYDNNEIILLDDLLYPQNDTIGYLPGAKIALNDDFDVFREIGCGFSKSDLDKDYQSPEMQSLSIEQQSQNFTDLK